jgi:hypothetical protein
MKRINPDCESYKDFFEEENNEVYDIDDDKLFSAYVVIWCLVIALVLIAGAWWFHRG